MSPTASPKSKQALSISVGEHCRRINALADKLANAERKVEEYQRSIGQHIASIKAVRPNDWEKIVKVNCKLGRSRAYELLAIADGTKTVKQTRAEKAGSVRRLRARRPLRSGQTTTAPVEVEQANDDDAPTDAAALAKEIVAVVPRKWDGRVPGCSPQPKPAGEVERVRRQGLLNRAAEAVFLARYDDLDSLPIDEEMRKAVDEVVNAWTELRARVAEREAGPASTANAPAVTKQPEPPATKNVVSPAAEPAEQPGDVIEPDCDGELVWRSGES